MGLLPVLCPEDLPPFSRLLTRQNTGSFGLPPRKISSFLCSAKDDLVQKTPGVHSIIFMCGTVYNGQAGCPK